MNEPSRPDTNHLVRANLRQLRLPTIGAEFATLAHEAGSANQPYDQYLLPITLAAMQGQRSRFRTLPVSRHATTQIDLIRRFVDIPIPIEHPANRETVVTVG